MKIAIVTNFLYPDGLGGTELYCYQLANALIERGNEVYWFVPNFNKTETISEERGNGIKIIRFAGVEIDTNEEATLALTTESFIKEMRARGIRIAHFHEFGGVEGVSMELLADTKKAGISTIVTFHLANYVCQTGTLRYGGLQPCNGKIVLNRCGSCHLFSDRTSSASLNLTLTKLFSEMFKLNTVRSIPRIKRFISGINMKQQFITTVSEYADTVVTLTNWFKDILIINGVPENKISYIQQVSPDTVNDLLHQPAAERRNYLFIGRVNKEKGVDLILDLASRLKKELPDICIDIYGPYTPTDILPHTIISNLGKYDNIKYKGILKFEEVLPVMAKYKAVILPSRVAEMAPLIILEANKLRVPVIASDVPGSVELVTENDCGLIFKYQSADDLFRKIKEMEVHLHEFSFKQPEKNNFNFTAQKYEELYARPR